MAQNASIKYLRFKNWRQITTVEDGRQIHKKILTLQIPALQTEQIDPRKLHRIRNKKKKKSSSIRIKLLYANLA